jgi:Zn-dependent peptidase ImmA (M78 family)/transcriptional regulator with XRE-family HTH domain
MPDSRTGTQPWDTVGYSDILAAETVSGELSVRFANGDTVCVALDKLGLAEATAFSVDRDDTTKVVVELGSQLLEVDWTRLRAASDPAFAKELRSRDSDEARRVGRRLKALREDRLLRQDAVAEQVGMTPPQLSKIERGQSDLRMSTVGALLRVMHADFADIAGPDAPEASLAAIAKAGRKAGVPREVIAALIAAVPRKQVSELLDRAFGWTTPELLAGKPLPELALPLNFKAARREPPADSPLLHLAFAATVAVRNAAEVLPAQALSSDPRQLQKLAANSSGTINLESLIRAAWCAGIDVVPLRGSGAFSGVAWIVEEKPAIVLKESRDLLVFWLFDLAHELGHHALGHVAERAVVDVERPDLLDGDELEQQANTFALQLLLPDHERLVAEVREDSLRGQPHLRFKFAVERVAAAHGVNEALLAMVAAYALEDVAEQKDRWGSATNIAKKEPPGAETARRVVSSYLSPDELDIDDAAILRAVVLD